MLVREIMSAPAICITHDADLDGALQLMAEKRVTALPVVDEEDRLVGVLSEIDLLRLAVEPDTRAHAIPLQDRPPLPRSVAEIMTQQPRSTTENADVADIVQLFTASAYKSLPVVRGDVLVGIISRSDVIRALWRKDEDLLDDLVRAFEEYGQKHWRISVARGMVEITGTGSARERDIAAAIAHSVVGVRRVHVTEGEDA